jgi:hypothetical protein
MHGKSFYAHGRSFPTQRGSLNSKKPNFEFRNPKQIRKYKLEEMKTEATRARSFFSAPYLKTAMPHSLAFWSAAALRRFVFLGLFGTSAIRNLDRRVNTFSI